MLNSDMGYRKSQNQVKRTRMVGMQEAKEYQLKFK